MFNWLTGADQYNYLLNKYEAANNQAKISQATIFEQHLIKVQLEKKYEAAEKRIKDLENALIYAATDLTRMETRSEIFHSDIINLSNTLRRIAANGRVMEVNRNARCCRPEGCCQLCYVCLGKGV